MGAQQRVVPPQCPVPQRGCSQESPATIAWGGQGWLPVPGRLGSALREICPLAKGEICIYIYFSQTSK